MEKTPPLHTAEVSRLAVPNRVFAFVYSSALLTLFYRHIVILITLFHRGNSLNLLFLSFSLLVADLFFAFMWALAQSFRMRPLRQHEYPELVKKAAREADNDDQFPAMDVFVCTADPYMEPPMRVVNTSLSVMAYDYPLGKISVYVSDDGGSTLTLFAFFEAAKFAAHWLPFLLGIPPIWRPNNRLLGDIEIPLRCAFSQHFCRENNVVLRSPEEFFAAYYGILSPEAEKIKALYDCMKLRVESVVKRGKVDDEYITDDQDRRRAFSKWTDGFTRQDHPTVIQVILDMSKDRDVRGDIMPNLIYISREKSRALSHHFKAGALNVLCFRGINKDDIYACEMKKIFFLFPRGMDGLLGPYYMGTGCFFNRRAFFGGPSDFVAPELPELSPENNVAKPIQSPEVIELAHHVATCNYENHTVWGHQIGARYGSLVEDYFTGYNMQCEGWKTIFCNPERAAFYGNAPISLVDVLNQTKRWAVGLLEVGFSKYCPLTFGTAAMGPLMAFGYAHCAFWPISSVPVTIYAFLPQLALMNGFTIFPNVSEPWFALYTFLFVGAYGQDLLDFIVEGGTIRRWWNDQRMWLIRSLSCYLFGLTEFFAKSLGISTFGFTLTSKVIDEEQSKRYEQGIFEFGLHSPLFITLAMAAIINMVSLICGLVAVLRGKAEFGEILLQLLISVFAVTNCRPVYEAMIFRMNQGGIPVKTTLTSTSLVSILVVISFLVLC